MFCAWKEVKKEEEGEKNARTTTIFDYLVRRCPTNQPTKGRTAPENER
jgi:hypothetical protein